jgi:hypothetical protein
LNLLIAIQVVVRAADRPGRPALAGTGIRGTGRICWLLITVGKFGYKKTGVGDARCGIQGLTDISDLFYSAYLYFDRFQIPTGFRRDTNRTYP